MKRMKTMFLAALICANVVVGTQALADTELIVRCFWTACITDGVGCAFTWPG